MKFFIGLWSKIQLEIVSTSNITNFTLHAFHCCSQLSLIIQQRLQLQNPCLNLTQVNVNLWGFAFQTAHGVFQERLSLGKCFIITDSLLQQKLKVQNPFFNLTQVSLSLWWFAFEAIHRIFDDKLSILQLSHATVKSLLSVVCQPAHLETLFNCSFQILPWFSFFDILGVNDVVKLKPEVTDVTLKSLKVVLLRFLLASKLNILL